MRRPLLLVLAGLGAVACAEGSADPNTAPAELPASSSLRFTIERVPALERDSVAPVTTLWDASAGRPRRVRGAFTTAEGDPERAARDVLRRHAALFRLAPDGSDLRLAASRSGLAGTYLRFQQIAGGEPVFGGEVVVLVGADEGAGRPVRMVNLAHLDVARAALRGVPRGDVGAAGAIAAARAAVSGDAPRAEAERGLHGGRAPLRRVYRVRLGSDEPQRAWEALVDASTGAALEVRDLLQRATGRGLVFDPNPVASTGTVFADNGDATSPGLDAARFSVALPNLDGSGYVRGAWVDARTKNANQRAFNAGLVFDFSRDQSGFEQANAYFHIDRAQTRLQALGFSNANARRIEIISDGQQADNAFYDPMKKNINYGQGGVDDAEDGDLVLHEYGHSIQDDQVPGYGSGGDGGALGEGFGDYFATSINRSLSRQTGDPYCLGEWDATAYETGNPPCLRRTDGTKHFPEFADGEVHDDGEMWASALVGIEDAVGADVAMRLVVESHFSQSTTEAFFTASQSLLDADAALFGGQHQDVVRRRLIRQGVSRILSTPSPLTSVVQSVAVSIDPPREPGGQYRALLDDTKTFTHPGAAALRVHFTSIDTELDPSCVDGGCDNLYLTDALGDLYQVLNGQRADVSSVVIPGDTVHIRLVSDANTQATGYHVDRIDVLGSIGPSSSTASSGGSVTTGTGGAGTGGAGTGGATTVTSGGTGGAGTGGATTTSSAGGAATTGGTGGAGGGGAGGGGAGAGGAPAGSGGATGSGGAATGSGGAATTTASGASTSSAGATGGASAASTGTGDGGDGASSATGSASQGGPAPTPTGPDGAGGEGAGSGGASQVDDEEVATGGGCDCRAAPEPRRSVAAGALALALIALATGRRRVTQARRSNAMPRE